MALGDGIRYDIALVSQAERDRFIAAIVKLDTTKFFPDGVSFWDKQEDIHKNAHFAGVDVHFGAAFIPWHRVIVNRLEQLLREVDPALSLHYWDWTTDPRAAAGGRAALFTDQFMDNASGEVSHLLGNFESTEAAEGANNHSKIWRDVGGSDANPDGTPALASDTDILAAGTNFASFATALKDAHDSVAHSYIGGTISDPHYSFHDPFVFLLHSNVDRLWARWQTESGHPERMDPNTAYAGFTPQQLSQLANENVEPWAGGTGLEPWASDPTKRAVVTYTDVSVVTPPCYDTNQSNFQVALEENPFNPGTNRYQIEFNEVPEEETTWRAAVLRIYTCGDVTINVKSGTEPAAPFEVVTPSVLAKQGPTPFREVRIWFEFTAGAVGTAPQSFGPVNTTLVCAENTQEFDFELIADTIHRPTVAVQMSLDQSGSMADAAGTSGTTRLQVLKDAAELFANLIQKNNGIGIVRFDDDAYPPNDPTYGGMPLTKVLSDEFSDGARLAALNAISTHGAYGATSVGDGLEMAHNQLQALPAGSYDETAILLLTDGLENRPKDIDDVTDLIDNTVFAVGLGNEAQVNTHALSKLAGSTGGYLLLSGLLSASLDDQFRLRKFFLQILAGVTNNSIVKDPVGYVTPAAPVRIPFLISETDINCRVINLTDFPIVNLAVETPDGEVIDETNANAFGVRFEEAAKVQTARFNLPLAFKKRRFQSGTWHALLEIDREVVKRWASMWGLESTRAINRSAITELASRGAKFCLSVHSFSNLRMRLNVSQTGFTPGSAVMLRVALTEYSVPVEHRATVRARVEHPDQTQSMLTLSETGPGIFTASMTTESAGIYRFHVIAEGGTFRGTPFSREMFATAAVWTGGKDVPPRPGDGDATRWCRLLMCLLEDKRLGEDLRGMVIDVDHLRECVRRFCRERGEA